jgi:hypothetical protein
MGRDKEVMEACHEAWDEARDVPDRIERLRAVAGKHPGSMNVLCDIATSQVEMGDLEGARRTYREIVDGRKGFDTVWENDLGLAYMYLGDVPRALEALEAFNGFSWDHGLHMALAHLMAGRRDEFEERFDRWMSEDLRRTCEAYGHRDVVRSLLGEGDAAYVEGLWAGYARGYEDMTPYERYLKVRGQHIAKLGCEETEDGEVVELDPDPEDDWEPNVPRRLGEAEFYALMREYLYLERMANLDDLDDKGWKRYERLADVLWADTSIG